MNDPAIGEAKVYAREAGWQVVGFECLALLAAVATVRLTSSWNHWNVGELVAITALAIAGDLTSVETSSSKVRVSGTLLGLMLAAVLLGPGPAALVGMLTIAIGWFRWREPPEYLAANLVTYAWFPLVSGLFFHAAQRLFHLDSGDVYYYLMVFPAFLVGLLINFAGVAGYQCYRDGSSIAHKAREALLPILSAELFSAVLIVAAVFFVVHTGTIGIAVLVAVLAIFQYLVGELLKSQQRAEELHRKATTDELTGLANRERFSEVLGERIAAGGSDGDSFAVMLIDLDHFKEINDTLGHHYGDVLLQDLGPRLADRAGPDGLVARLGGDEFAVLTPALTEDPGELGAIATELLDCVQQPIVVDELTLEVGASIGISRFPLDGDDGHDLLRRADVAMYSAKEEHSSYKLYELALDRYSVKRLTVLSDFRRGLESNEFVLHYQPIVSLDHSHVHGAEALVRWQHPRLGAMPPSDFIPIAEQSGLIGPLTSYVLAAAVSQCARWRADGRKLSVAVNLSVRDLLDLDLPTQVESVLNAYGLPAEALQLEITESMIMSDPERALGTVTRLRDLGVRMSIDDFGMGYSSLSILKRLPIDELKIDRTFVSSLMQDESDAIIVRSTINLGHDLGLNVVAEGVEDETTLKRLAMLGCDLAQGYHLGAPLPNEQFVELIDEMGRPLARVLSA